MHNRRQVLIAGTFYFSELSRQSAARSAVQDVIIVGGGTAGLSAARALLAGGRAALVLEAAPRLGGRAFTDTASLGLPFERGAAVIGAETGRQILAIAKTAGFRVNSFEPAIRLFSQGIPATAVENDALEMATEEIAERILVAASQDNSGPASSIYNDGDPVGKWQSTAEGLISAMTDGVAMEDRSIADWAALRHGEIGRSLTEGLGTLVQRLAQGVSFEVNSKVHRIAERSDRVEVYTNRGKLDARAVIVTVPAGVLASGAIAWEPALPDPIRSAIEAMGMGYLEKVAFSLGAPSPILGLEPDTFIATPIEDSLGCYIHARPHGLPMAVVHFGGGSVRELVQAGNDSMIAAASNIMQRALGSNAMQGRLRSASTQWSKDPLTMGAISVVKPGTAFKPRATLATRFSKRIIFAGEAIAHEDSQTLPGAYESGEKAAQELLRTLKKQ